MRFRSVFSVNFAAVKVFPMNQCNQEHDPKRVEYS